MRLRDKVFRRQASRDLDPAWWVRRLSSNWLRRNLERIEAVKGRDEAAGRTEFARVCYLYSCLIRGEEIGAGEHGDRTRRGYSNIDGIVFLPLEAKDHFAFVSRRPVGDGAASPFERVNVERLHAFESRALLDAAQNLVQRLTIDGRAESSEEAQADVGAVRAVAIGASECRRHLASLVDLIESLTAGGPEEPRTRQKITHLLLIRQAIENTPNCLIVLTRRGRAATFEGQDAEIESATQLLFETYRVSRLQGFTEAYRELVDKRLLLGAQLANLQQVRHHLETEGLSPEPMDEFVYSFCQSLVEAKALPEMDNALFFPLVGRRYYLYRSPVRRSESTAWGSLVVGDLAIHATTADTVLASEVETPHDAQEKCRRVFEARVRHLGLVGPGSAASNEQLRESLAELTEAIQKPLAESAAVAREGKGLIGYVDAAVFSLAQWRDWGFEAIDRRFLHDLNGGDVGDEAGGSGTTGSLLALTILFDHLPLGILFLNSGLSGAFGEEDRKDVRGIAKAYFQTFQLGELSKIVHDYQALEGQLTIEAVHRDDPSAMAVDFDQSLKEYAETLIGSFPSLEACIWLALDRDALHVFTRDPSDTAKVQRSKKTLGWRLKTLEQEIDPRDLVERLQTGLKTREDELRRDRKRQAAEQPGASRADELKQAIAQNTVRWIYCWAMLRGTGDKTPDRYPNLEEIPARVLRVKTAPGVLLAHLESACFDACILDDEFPYLRHLVAADERHRGLLTSPSGSLMGFLIFYEGLHKGLLLLASNAELSFTAEIELKDAQLATRAFFLPVQMAVREKVIREYQRLLLDERSSPAGESSEVLDFMLTMQGALPTMKCGLFIPLNSDRVYALLEERQGEPASDSWSCSSELRGFGTTDRGSTDSLTALIEKLTAKLPKASGIETGVEATDRRGIDKLEIRHLYLLCLRDVLEGRRNPQNYRLDEVVGRIYERDGTRETVSGLKTYSHVSCWPTCVFQANVAFPLLEVWLELETGVGSDRKNLMSELKRFWKGQGSLLAIGLLNEGLPLGIMLLGSDVPGSFGEQERLDVEAAAKVFFRAGQIDYRDTVISSYRDIVRDVLSEDGMSREIEELKKEPGYELGDDEFGAYLAYFMETIYTAYTKDPPSDIVFFPLDGEQVYVSLPPGPGGGARPRLQRIPASSMELGSGVSWTELRKKWLTDTIGFLVQGQAELEAVVESANSPEAALSAVRERVDLCLRTILLRGHRYAEPLMGEDRAAYLAPFVHALEKEAGLKWREAGSLLITAMLYDPLPVGGLLIMNSPIPWRFIEQDRVDVEAVAKAYFLTYRSICLKREAARAARLSGMQQVLLGVTHRLKNDLQPTYTVLDSLRNIEEENPPAIGARIIRLKESGQIESGAQGIEQVQKKFSMLRSIVTGGRQPKRVRTLAGVADKFAKLVEMYKRRLPMLFAGFETEEIVLRVHEIPEELTGDPEISSLIMDPECDWIDVTDGIEEVLAIYAENAVRAVGGHASLSRDIYFWFGNLPASNHEVAMTVFDRVVIPKEKMPFIAQGEAIPTEVGGGSGTGLYNARNLLQINKDGKQIIRSDSELNGTLIRVPLRRLLVTPVRVTADMIKERIQSSLVELQRCTDFLHFRWQLDDLIPDQESFRMYDGSYRWSLELFELTWQIFGQRKANLEEEQRWLQEIGTSEDYQDIVLSSLQELEMALSEYSVSVSCRPSSGAAIIEFRDNAMTGFLGASGMALQGTEPEDELLLDKFERHHNRRSLAGPEGSVGELYTAMRDRLKKTCLINITVAEGEQGCAVVSMKIPSWREEGL